MADNAVATSQAAPELTQVDRFINEKSGSADWLNRHVPADAPVKFLRGQNLIARRLGKNTFFARTRSRPGKPNILFYFPTPDRTLAATLLALAAWGENPPGAFKLLIGPVDHAMLEGVRNDLAADAIIYAQGEYVSGRPLINLGLKGLLEVELRVKTMSKPAPGAYSEVIPAASWIIVRALDTIKSDAQEVRISGFEDNIAPIPAEESKLLQKTVGEHAERLQNILKEYDLPHYFFELSDFMVLQTMYRVPTVNVSAIECGTFNSNGRLVLPPTARARLDLQLVPYQDPQQVFENLTQFLRYKGYTENELEIIQLPGAYFASRTPLATPFVQACIKAFGEAGGGEPLFAPIAPAAGPLSILREYAGDAPGICTALSEKPSETDFALHARWLARLPLEVTPAPRSRKKAAPDDFEDIKFELPPDFDPVLPGT
jgi:hypothetical protein